MSKKVFYITVSLLLKSKVRVKVTGQGQIYGCSGQYDSSYEFI